jgi:aminopeptidase N
MPRPRPAFPTPLPLLHLVTVLVALVALVTGEVHAAPYRFPATPGEEQGQVRDERDVAPFLAAWKAAGLRRARLLAAPATANQQAYDVHYYDLDLTPNPATAVLTGTVRMKASVVSGPLSTVDLDFYANLAVDAATSGGSAATWSRSGDVLTVNLDRAYATGELLDVVVAYHGSPGVSGSFGFSTANGRNLIWSLSEPFGARSWWPCKDAPEDKADSVDLRVTVPTGMVTASNGTRVEATDNGTVAVTRWRERYPIATYLVSLTSYPYTVTTDRYRTSPTDSMLIQFFNFPESVAGAAAVQAKVKDMIAAYAGIFGEYPFIAEKYGHAQFLWGGGMEHQTCTSLGNGAYIEWIVAHELAHQWWGDLVTCRDFHHVWVNEGFATYCEALWAESTGGSAAYHGDINLNKYFGAGTIYVPDLSDENRIFDSDLSYDKGSWVLHMLRRVLGDSTFFAAMRQFYVQYGYSTATTEDFRDVCEAVSGRDLDAFFQQWIYGEYYPHYLSSWTSAAAAGGYDVTLRLDQIQTWQLFNMPLDVKVTTAAGEQSFVIQDSLASQTFTLHVDAQPTAVAVDPDDWVLKVLESPVVDPPLDRHVLLVNGVDWASYGTEITSAYTDHAFSGGYPFDFWDVFSTPSGGYPAVLPVPLGHGAVPPEVMGHYRVVIWVGNNWNGDLVSWQTSPVLSYLRAGGNVLLLSRYGDQFLGDSLRNYLGVTLATGTTLNDCVATRPGLGTIARLGTQNTCVVFDTVRTRTDTQLLYKVVSGYTPNRGIGFIRQPVEGGTHRPDGGRFIFLSGRPYRWNHANLAANVETMLLNYFGEYAAPVAVDGPPAPPARLELALARPNPFDASTALRFSLPRAGAVRIEVLDPQGRRVRGLYAGSLDAGPHDVAWNGLDEQGNRVAMGIYWVRVAAGAESATRKVVRIR